MGPYGLAFTGGPALVYAVVGIAAVISGGVVAARRWFTRRRG